MNLWEKLCKQSTREYTHNWFATLVIYSYEYKYVKWEYKETTRASERESERGKTATFDDDVGTFSNGLYVCDKFSLIRYLLVVAIVFVLYCCKTVFSSSFLFNCCLQPFCGFNKNLFCAPSCFFRFIFFFIQTCLTSMLSMICHKSDSNFLQSKFS